MSVSDLRFGTVQALRAAAKRASFVAYSKARDKRGYFINGYELDPIIRELTNEMKAAARQVSNANKEPPKEEVEKGPVQRVREWTNANPKATKDDALAQFPDLNPATVRIQFNKARQGSANK